MEQLWFFMALTSAGLWGLGYALSEKVLQKGVSPASLMVIQGALALPLYLLIAKLTNHFKQDWEILTSDNRTLLFAIIFSLSIVMGNFLIFTSIGMKNATLANLIEIAYPLFTFFFAWLLFRDVQLTWPTALGGLLIFSGISVIYLKG